MISCLCLAWNMNSLFKIEMLTYPGWGLLEEDCWVQLQDRFENLFQTKEDVRNRWLRTENWFNSTYWYRVRISQVTKETSFAARIHSHSVRFKFSVGRLWRNCWRITSLSREILFFEIFFFEARVSWNILRWSLHHSQSSPSKAPSFEFYVKLQTENKFTT